MDKQELKLINGLINKIGCGETQALQQLYQSVGGRMLSVAIGITKDKHLAEDAVQESLIKIVKYASSFSKHYNGYGWICTVVRNESLTIIKKYRTPESNIEDYLNLSDLCAADKMHQNLELEIAVNQLDLNDRELIWLRYMCDMTVRDIATYLRTPKSTIMRKLKKAEESLRQRLL